MPDIGTSYAWGPFAHSCACHHAGRKQCLTSHIDHQSAAGLHRAVPGREIIPQMRFLRSYVKVTRDVNTRERKHNTIASTLRKRCLPSFGIAQKNDGKLTVRLRNDGYELVPLRLGHIEDGQQFAFIFDVSNEVSRHLVY